MSGKPGMADVYVECVVAGDGKVEAQRAADEQALCFALYRVKWLQTLEPIDSERVLCRFRAPDAESVRQVLRRIDVRIESVWIARDD